MTKKKPPTPEPGDVVLVEWNDIHDDPSWQATATPAPHECRCESVGFLGSIGSKYVVLIKTYGDIGEKRVAGDRLTIPRGCITSLMLLVKRPKETA